MPRRLLASESPANHSCAAGSMLHFTVDVQEIEVISPGGRKPAASEQAAATFHSYCWPPDSEEPPTKRRRITADGFTAADGAADGQPDYACLSRITFDLAFPMDAHEVLPTTERAPELLITAADLASPSTLRLQLFRERSSETLTMLLATQRPQESLQPHLKLISKLLNAKNSARKTAATSRILLTHAIISPGSAGAPNPSVEIRLLCAMGIEGEEGGRVDSSIMAVEKEVLSYYFPPTCVPDAPWNIQSFYESVHVPTEDSAETPDMPKGLLDCTLYPFQRRSVQWMLSREGVLLSEGNVVPLGDERARATDPALTFEHGVDCTMRRCLVSHLRRMVISDVSTLSDDEVARNRGILAEEMGLGKTVELTALISLHRRAIQQPAVFDHYTGTQVTASGATLIITPPGILQQWKRELNDHAPHLKVMSYEGMPPINALRKHRDTDMVQELLKYDVVLTTYHVLSREIHYANTAPKRDLRGQKRYEPRRSPLVQISWWRCCLDEAQMIESGVSQAATVARVIPRINAWAVSGTPVRKNVQDLLGLLIFLRLEPFCSSKYLWGCIDRRSFHDIFSTIALRHTKDQVREELRLLPQKRVVMLVPFTPVEEQNYSQLVQQLCEDCGLSREGRPVEDGVDLDNSRIVERLRGWLTRLRQTCLHPQVGGRNRRALGRGNAPLRTVNEVLDVMIEQNDTLVRAEEREYLLAQVVRGHILGVVKSDTERSRKALDIYTTALKQAEVFVADARRELAEEEAKLNTDGANSAGKHGIDSRSEPESDSEEEKDGKAPGRISVLRKALRSALEVQHICTFYVASAYYQIKTNEDLTEPASGGFRDLEGLETLYYDRAKGIRKELLRESHSRAERAMKKIKDQAKSQVPDIPLSDDHGGIENRRILDKMDRLTESLNEQGAQLNEWRQQAARILLLPLVDEDDGEITGEEYEASTKAQDELQAYITMLRALIADRHRLLTGQTNHFVDEETSAAKRQAKDGTGPAPELVLKLAAKRDRLKPTDADHSLRGIIAEARSLVTTLQWASENRNARASTELRLAERQLEATGKVFNEETKKLTKLEKELEEDRVCMNLRVEFYRQLQVLSDQLKPYKEELDEELDEAALRSQRQKEDRANDRLAGFRTKQRFLLHLKTESKEQEGPRLCVICQTDFEMGVLTVCGHQYCKECFTAWARQHRTCPLCKRRLNLGRDFHEITYKPKELRAQEEHQATPVSDGPSSSGSCSTSIYTEISPSAMEEIKQVDLNGSFGTKIDTLARHLLWIRQNDPGSKSVVFSQYGDFLKVLGDAFRQFKIGSANIAEKGSVERFKQDPSVECFLLDAKSDASGLNLVNASYVFLMEPLINAAIELQAIARIHRIGQQRPTTVFMYLAVDTVEENIYEISVRRRLEHMAGQMKGKWRSGSSTPAVQEKALDAANTLELQQAPVSRLLVQQKGGGEVVSKEDVWSCVFGQRQRQGSGRGQEREVEVGRFLRAAAAEGRRGHGL